MIKSVSSAPARRGFAGENSKRTRGVTPTSRKFPPPQTVAHCAEQGRINGGAGPAAAQGHFVPGILTSGRSNGFTLMEMLVVLVLTSLIVGILFDGLSFASRIQEQFGDEIGRTQSRSMQLDWFRQTIAGLLPDYEDGKNKFFGEPRQMHGLTLTPLNYFEGAPTAFGWTIEYKTAQRKTVLAYSAQGSTTEVLSWEGRSGRFSYIDAQGAEHDHWPPMGAKTSGVPAAVYLDTGEGDNRSLIVAVPKGPIRMLPRRLDIENS